MKWFPSLLLFSKFIQEGKYVLKHKQVHQTIVNVAANIISILLGLVTVTILIRTIGSETYGKLGLILTIISTINIVTGFGFFQAYSRVLLYAKEDDHKEVIGTGLLIFLSQLLVLFLITLITLPFINYIYNSAEITKTIFFANFITSFIVFNTFFLITTRNINQMYWQAIKDILQSFLYFIFIIITLNYISSSMISIIIATELALLIPIILYLIIKQPSFKHVKRWWIKIKKEQKNFGIHIYVTQVFERFTFNLDNLMLGKFAYEHVAFYSLGVRLVYPINLLSKKFADSYLKKFTLKNNIPPRIFLYNIIWWSVATTGLIIISKPLITFLWGEEFLIIRSFLFIIALSALCANLYNIIFMFLYSKGIGKEQKKYFIIRGIINLVGNIMLIPFFNITGAILGTLLSNLYFLIGMLHEYKKYKVNNL